MSVNCVWTFTLQSYTHTHMLVHTPLMRGSRWAVIYRRSGCCVLITSVSPELAGEVTSAGFAAARQIRHEHVVVSTSGKKASEQTEAPLRWRSQGSERSHSTLAANKIQYEENLNVKKNIYIEKIKARRKIPALLFKALYHFI